VLDNYDRSRLKDNFTKDITILFRTEHEMLRTELNDLKRLT